IGATFSITNGQVQAWSFGLRVNNGQPDIVTIKNPTGYDEATDASGGSYTICGWVQPAGITYGQWIGPKQTGQPFKYIPQTPDPTPPLASNGDPSPKTPDPCDHCPC